VEYNDGDNQDLVLSAKRVGFLRAPRGKAAAAAGAAAGGGAGAAGEGGVSRKPATKRKARTEPERKSGRGGFENKHMTNIESTTGSSMRMYEVLHSPWKVSRDLILVEWVCSDGP
jgi:hypothetical protein